jgi:hypothetical protein
MNEKRILIVIKIKIFMKLYFAEKIIEKKSNPVKKPRF